MFFQVTRVVLISIALLSASSYGASPFYRCTTHQAGGF